MRGAREKAKRRDAPWGGQRERKQRWPLRQEEGALALLVVYGVDRDREAPSDSTAPYSFFFMSPSI